LVATNGSSPLDVWAGSSRRDDAAQPRDRLNCLCRLKRTEGRPMWWGIGFGALLYFVIAFTLGLMTLRKGHWVMFIVGIFIPLFWLIGAVMRPTATAPAP
jgi:hypothetical protein